MADLILPVHVPLCAPDPEQDFPAQDNEREKKQKSHGLLAEYLLDAYEIVGEEQHTAYGMTAFNHSWRIRTILGTVR